MAPTRPSPEQRQFVSELNALSERHSSATFGDPGAMVPTKARRQMAFALSARRKWPEFGGGDLRTVQADDRGGARVDPECGFWKEGQRRYLAALSSYFDALQEASSPTTVKELLGDLGFHLVEDFISEREELDLMSYWRVDGPIYPFGVEERYSRRRFFNYGPVLPRETSGTTKSTLNVVPAKFGAMPPLVERQRLRDRLRAALRPLLRHEGSTNQVFDQMYVNHYDVSVNSYIDFHHDHMSSMLGVVAGVSLASPCEFQLRPLEKGLRRTPLRIQLPRRSLFFMTGLSRWHLQHGIPSLTESRLSLTFRTVDRSCSSRGPEVWDREWHHLSAEEASNAIWPLVTPDGVEVHLTSDAPTAPSKGPSASSAPRSRGRSRQRPLADFLPYVLNEKVTSEVRSRSASRDTEGPGTSRRSPSPLVRGRSSSRGPQASAAPSAGPSPRPCHPTRNGDLSRIGSVYSSKASSVWRAAAEKVEAQGEGEWRHSFDGDSCFRQGSEAAEVNWHDPQLEHRQRVQDLFRCAATLLKQAEARSPGEGQTWPARQGTPAPALCQDARAGAAKYTFYPQWPSGRPVSGGQQAWRTDRSSSYYRQWP